MTGDGEAAYCSGEYPSALLPASGYSFSLGESGAAGRERARFPEPGQGVLPRGARSLLSANQQGRLELKPGL